MSDARQRGTTLGNRVVSASGGVAVRESAVLGESVVGVSNTAVRMASNVAFARLVVLLKTTAGCTADGGWEGAS